MLLLLAWLARAETAYYCLCPNPRAAACKATQACGSPRGDEIPPDHYFSSKTNDLLLHVQNGSASARIYLVPFVASEESAYHALSLATFDPAHRVTLELVSLNGRGDTRTRVTFPSAPSPRVAVAFRDVSSVTVRYAAGGPARGGNISSLALSNSVLGVGDDEWLFVTDFAADMRSLAALGGQITVAGVANVSAADVAPNQAVHGITLGPAALLAVHNVSRFATVSLRPNTLEFARGDDSEILFNVRAGSRPTVVLHEDGGRPELTVVHSGGPEVPVLKELLFDISEAAFTTIDFAGNPIPIGVIASDEATRSHNLTFVNPGDSPTLAIAGNLNLSLDTYETVRAFKSYICSGSLDLNALSLYFEQHELIVEVQHSRVNVLLGNESTDESYSIDIGNLSVLFIHTSEDISIKSIPDPAGVNESEATAVYIVLEEEGTVTLDGESWNSRLSSLKIEHRKSATIQTEDGFVPDLGIDPPVAELFFKAEGGNTCNVSHSVECRKGPSLTVIVPHDAVVSQKDFLAADTFFAGNDNPKLTFQYLGEALVNYTFSFTTVEFVTDRTVSFAGLTLWHSPLSRRSGKLDLKAHRLTADVVSLPNSSFLSLEVNSSCLIRDNYVSRINLTDTSVQVLSQDIWTPYVTQQHNAPIIVETNSSNVVIGVNKDISKSVLSEFKLRCMSGVTIELEVSFYQVRNPEDVEIVVLYGNKVTLKTGLVNLPDVSVYSETEDLEQTIVTKQPIFTPELAFWAFLALVGIMGVISIVLCMVGHYCLPPEEEFDVSSDEESEGKSKKD
jgi:hypothetical protein